MATCLVVNEVSKLIRVTDIAFQIPQLSTLHNAIPGFDLGLWNWRPVRNLHERIVEFGGARSVGALASFQPRFLSEGRHQDFIWAKWHFGKNKVEVFIGDIADCNFADKDDLKAELLVPRGWATAVFRLIRSGIIAFESNGRAVHSDGDRGLLMNHPALASFQLQNDLEK